MEAINQIKKEFQPIIKNENEKINAELWNVTTAEANAPGNTNPVILTPAIWEQYWNGEEIPQLRKAIDSSTEYYLLDYFHYNNYLLVDSDIKIYLTSYYRQDDWKDNLLIETQPEYNALYNELPGTARDYFKVSEDYTPYYFNVEDEALDFLTWTIMEDNLEGSDWKDTITDKDIITAIGLQSKDHQEIIRTANYRELLDDIKNTYNKIIREYMQESQEALYNKFYDEIYFQAQEAAENDVYTNYTGRPIKEVI